MDYFNPQMDIREINNLSMLGLAHVGDAVYELMTRTLLCTEGHAQANDLHHRNSVKIYGKLMLNLMKKHCMIFLLLLWTCLQINRDIMCRLWMLPAVSYIFHYPY